MNFSISLSLADCTAENAERIAGFIADIRARIGGNASVSSVANTSAPVKSDAEREAIARWQSFIETRTGNRPSRFRRSRDEKGMSIPEAISYRMKAIESGAIVFSSDDSSADETPDVDGSYDPEKDGDIF